jgi:hypothetical protein
MGNQMPVRAVGHFALLAVPMLVLAGLSLAGCAPEPAPGGASNHPSATPSQSASPSPDPVAVTADTVAVMTATATAQNGSVLQLRLVVLKSVAWSDPVGLPRSTATTTWCEGELDQSVYESNNYGFAQVDYSAKLSGSQIAWPSDLLVRLLPSPGDGVSETAAGGAYQVEPPAPDNDPGFYVPHCQQPAYMSGAGTGSVYLGFDGDTVASPAFSLWAGQAYGWTFDPIDSTIDPSKVSISDCKLTVTSLGKSLGATAAGGAQLKKSTYCSLNVND